MKLKPLLYILIIGILSYSGFWIYLSQNAASKVRNIATSLEAKGIYLTYDNIEVSGFPYRLIITFKNPQFLLKEGFINLHWSEGNLGVFLQPWNLTHWIFLGSGGKIIFGSNPLNPNAKTLIPDSFRASFITAQGAEQRMSIEIKNSKYTNGATPLTALGIKTINLHAKLSDTSEAPQSNLYEPKIGDLILNFKGISISGREILGINNNFSLSMTPRGTGIPSFTHEGLSAWRDQGSTIDITKFSLKWFEGKVSGDGSLTLDENLLPLGIISGHFENPKLITDFLRFTGFVDTVQSDRVSSGLSTMASLLEQKEGAPTPFSISAQDGGLWLGAIKFKDIKPILK